MEKIIASYFKRGYTHNEILILLSSQHDIKMCLRTLQKKLKVMGLTRKYSYTAYDIRKVDAAVSSEIQNSSIDMGHRSMWHHLRCNRGIFTSRKQVMKTLRDLDPEGVSRRRAHYLVRRSYHSNSPNDVWHIDGYDKLKPYSFPVHGGIDGFSRKILWLNVVNSNNDPSIVGGLYFNCVASSCVPKRLQTDCDSENIIAEAV